VRWDRNQSTGVGNLHYCKCNYPFYFCLPSTKGGVNFSGWYLRVWLRSSGGTRIGLGEYPGETSAKGAHGTCSGEQRQHALSWAWGNFTLFNFVSRHMVLESTWLWRCWSVCIIQWFSWSLNKSYRNTHCTVHVPRPKTPSPCYEDKASPLCPSHLAHSNLNSNIASPLSLSWRLCDGAVSASRHSWPESNWTSRTLYLDSW
jgi:hypothetical protein